jgi:hypothetical protein
LENKTQIDQTQAKRTSGMNDKQISKLSELEKYRENIQNNLAEIEGILQIYFPDEFATAYQHWIPQIKTALNDNTKWLNRGIYTMQYTIDRILDSLHGNNDKGVSKYIK